MSVEPIAPYHQPLLKSVHVARTPAEAFQVFTAGIGRWWPLSAYSIRQEHAVTCVIEPRAGGAVYERDDAGRRFPWGRVLVWEPPRRLVMTWHPGRPEDAAQEVEVSFEAEDGGTRVRLEHRGWQALGEGAREARAGYAGGWDDVLGRHFAGACGRPAEETR
jgi:uncharacterized protein YndB with AHSA1/START domain